METITLVNYEVHRDNLRTGEHRLVHAVVETAEDAHAKAADFNADEEHVAARLNLPGPEYRYYVVEVTETRRELPTPKSTR